jgi:hypothetical protein
LKDGAQAVTATPAGSDFYWGGEESLTKWGLEGGQPSGPHASYKLARDIVTAVPKRGCFGANRARVGYKWAAWGHYIRGPCRLTKFVCGDAMAVICRASDDGRISAVARLGGCRLPHRAAYRPQSFSAAGPPRLEPRG